MESEEIVIDDGESKQTFGHFKDAFKSATTLSAKTGKTVNIILGKGQLKLKGNFSSNADVNIIGEEGTLLVLEASSTFVVKKGTLFFSSVEVMAENKAKGKTFVFTVQKDAHAVFEKCEFGPEEEASELVSGFLVQGSLDLNGCTLNKFRSIAQKGSKTKVTKSTFNGGGNDTEPPVFILSDSAKLTVEETNFVNVSCAIHAEKSTQVDVNSCVITNPIKSGLICEGSKGIIRDVHIECEKENDSKGLVLSAKASFDIKDLKLEGLGSYGLICKDESVLRIVGFNVKQNGATVFSVLNSDVEARKLSFADNLCTNIIVEGEKASFVAKEVELANCKKGFKLLKSEKIDISSAKVVNMTEEGFYFKDCSATVSAGHVTSKQKGAVGMKIDFIESKREKIVLNECKNQNCVEGIKIFQHKAAIPKQPMDDYAVQFEAQNSNNSRSTLSKCEMNNCSFITCNIGFSIDGARAVLSGCSFIMNKKHSIFMKNESLSQGGDDIRKHSKLKIRWPNYVEPRIDSGNDLANDSKLLNSVTYEKAFCGSADFEPLMYLPTLTERIRQAMQTFNSKEKNSVEKARVIMRSVNHMLVLLRALSEKLLKKDLLDDPELGMFAATFKLYDDSVKRKGKNMTLVTMQSLFESWQDLSRTRLFDKALSALNEAFRKEQVSGELYDDWITPLEEMQRVCFVKSKYNRRRDYLLQTAKEDPLSTWYFLDKEDPNTEEGQRLRSEVLKYLAKDEDANLQNKENFHSSWVAQWAVNLLGDSFVQQPIPSELSLRRAWCDKLLDDNEPKRIIDEYNRIGTQTGFSTETDKVLRFEAYVQYEKKVGTLSQEDIQVLTGLFNGVGYEQAVKNAANLFRGQGALPGYLRRLAELASTAEELLDNLSYMMQDNAGLPPKRKKEVVLAVMSHFYYPDSLTEPDVRKNTNGYETCPTCLVQKLQPWNELKLENCKFGHRFCKNCFKNSMSTAQSTLWGTCAGKHDGENCTALATRREMEMAKMDKEKIYNILNTRVIANLRNAKGWKQCDSPGCIGGRSNVTKDYYTCRLCKKMITQDNGKSDPTVAIRLLKGLDASPIARGRGTFRECYYCAVIYEKGDACSTITCSNCKKQFSMTFGPEHISHRFDEEGVGPQMYVPQAEGKLWGLGVFKTKKGKPLEKGAVLKEEEALEVVRRSKVLLKKLDG